MQPSAIRPVAQETSHSLVEQLSCLVRLAAAGGEGVVVADLQGSCLFLNDLAARLGGCTPAEGGMLSIREYLARLARRNRLADENWPVDAGPLNLESLAAAHRPWRFIHLSREAGAVSEQEQHYTVTLYALQDEAGATIGYALFLRDLTPLLQDGVPENSLLSSVSHDLRTPLTAIKAAVTGLLQEELCWDEALRRETLEDINEETDRLTTLVNALVEMSRIQGGALRLQTEWCDLAEIIHTVLDRLQKVTRYHRVVYDENGHLPLVQADYMQLDRVLSNLIENAVKYSPAGTEIRLVAEVHEAEIWVSVLDQGIGVPPEERERIFEKFYRVKQRRMRFSSASGAQTGASDGRLVRQMPHLAGGSGLGLAICRGIVQAHHGRIWVEPRPEGGSRFTFTLPLEQTAPVDEALSLEYRIAAESADDSLMPGQETGSQATPR